MKNKITTWVIAFYLLAAFGDYLAREGLKQGLIDKILWRDGFLPIISLAKGLLWPIHLANGDYSRIPSSQKKTVAQYFAGELNKTYKYPMCIDTQCIQSITANGNAIYAHYIIRQPSITEAEFKLKANDDLCRNIQKDFPDKAMKWIGTYYLVDGKYYTTTELTIQNCSEFKK